MTHWTGNKTKMFIILSVGNKLACSPKHFNLYKKSRNHVCQGTMGLGGIQTPDSLIIMNHSTKGISLQPRSQGGRLIGGSVTGPSAATHGTQTHAASLGL